MARLVKRGKVWQYEISYKKQNGTYSKLRKSGFKTKREAKEAADEIEYNLKNGLQGDKQSILLSEYFK
ncbi:Arm DNA-binding domain-containing protein, partial [Enterococcus faecalis]|nr:Arm DNA-binding domain-containing protein [Enterococcus faecalis]